MTYVFEIDEGRPPEQLCYTFGGATPVFELPPRSLLRTSTLDCFAGRVRTADDRSSVVCDPRYLNPQTGPFFVPGARPGDTLAVHLVSVEPREDWGVSTTVPLFGALTSTNLTASLQPALPELTWIYRLDRAAGLAHFTARDGDVELALPMNPMHGTMGVAPPLGEVRSSLTPGAWGGNMDTPELRAGVTAFFGVNVEGAAMSLGDGHARQGEGEACGVAIECAMDTSLMVDVVPGTYVAWPRLESDTHVMTTGSSRPLEDAFRIAHTEMVHWVSELLGLSTMDSYQLVSQIAESPIANVVDTTYTAVCKVSKDLIGNPLAMGGTHRDLRELARS
jgi:acetamidase/formamidase